MLSDWKSIVKDIESTLLSRNLKNPKRRINELINIENLLKENLPRFLYNPFVEFGKIDKKQFKVLVAGYKLNGKLNGAENSLINEIYYRINI